MLNESSFFDVLVKTLKNEAKSLKKSSGLPHSKALEAVCREFGFNHWKNVCELEKYIVLCFTNGNCPEINPNIHNRLIDKGFWHITSNAKFGQFLISQRFAPPVGLFYTDILEKWETDIYMSKTIQGLDSPEHVDSFIRIELDSPDYYFVFEGELYEGQDFQPYITEYDYLGEGG